MVLALYCPFKILFSKKAVTWWLKKLGATINSYKNNAFSIALNKNNFSKQVLSITYTLDKKVFERMKVSDWFLFRQGKTACIMP